MVRPAHRGQLLGVGDHRVGRAPDDRPEHEDREQPLGVGPEPLGPRNPLHPQPQIVVAGEEQHRDEERLDHPEPAHETAHQGDAHRLVVLIDLAAEPIAGERQDDERRHRDEVPDVAHPIVVRTLLVRLGGEKSVARVRGDHGAAEHDVGDQAMHVDRHPRRVGDHVPQFDGGRVGRGCDVARGAHHEGEPRVGDEHHDRAPDVEQNPQSPVSPLGAAVFPAVPAVVVQIEGEGLEQKQSGIQPHRWAEDRRQVAPESRVQGREEHRQQGAPDGRGAVRHEQQPGELFRQAVVALFLVEDPDRLGDDGEHGDPQHEGGEHQVHFCRDPHRRARADAWEVPVRGQGVRGCLERERDVRHQTSGLRIGDEEGLALGKVDRHRVANFG